MGANHGIVSTASLVLGVAASGAATAAIVTAGIADLVAGALSMAAGEYVSVSSQRDTERADLELEAREISADPEGEERELARIYERRGLPSALAREVAVALSEHDALGAVPIAVFAIKIPRNKASLGLPNTSVAAPNTAKIKLKTVNVFAIAIERYDRLVAGAGSRPRSRSRRSASAAVKPLVTATAVSLTSETRYIADRDVESLDVRRRGAASMALSISTTTGVYASAMPTLRSERCAPVGRYESVEVEESAFAAADCEPRSAALILSLRPAALPRCDGQGTDAVPWRAGTCRWMRAMSEPDSCG